MSSPFRLRHFRELKHVTQRELSERTRLDYSNIQRIELGINLNPSFDTIVRISVVLGVSPAEIFFTELPHIQCLRPL